MAAEPASVTSFDEAARRHLRQAVRALRSETRLPISFGGVVGPRGGLRLVASEGTVSDGLDGLEVPLDTGIGQAWTVLRGRPRATPDISFCRACHTQRDQITVRERLKAVLAVPVNGRAGLRAILFVAARHPVVLGDRLLTIAARVSQQLENDLQVIDEARQLLRTGAAALDLSESGWRLEMLRGVYADLRALSSRLGNSEVETELNAAIHRMGSALATSGAASSAVRLSPREVDTIASAALGLTNVEIARVLGLRPETVKSYLRSAFNKLGAGSRGQAVNAARAAGYLP